MPFHSFGVSITTSPLTMSGMPNIGIRSRSTEIPVLGIAPCLISAGDAPSLSQRSRGICRTCRPRRRWKRASRCNGRAGAIYCNQISRFSIVGKSRGGQVPDILGVHHVTAIAGDPQTNIDFYAGVLGLRLVKLTVNYDDPTTYHLYYGDGQGHPGTILTFFPWPSDRKSTRL